jgi:hypothetical protein
MRTALELAEKNLHSLSLLIVSPSDQGKTDTLDIFAEGYEGVWVVPPSSESRITELFEERRNITIIAIDEPYDWDATNYRSAAMMCKHVLSGKIGAPRSTLYVTGVVSRKRTKTGIILLCNKKQYDGVRRALAGCGLLERTLTVLTQQSTFETMDYIRNYYASHNNIEFEVEYQFCMRDITKQEQQFINKYFSDYARDSVTWIAKITPERVFDELKPFLISASKSRYEEEQILFKEVKT